MLAKIPEITENKKLIIIFLRLGQSSIIKNKQTLTKAIAKTITKTNMPNGEVAL